MGLEQIKLPDLGEGVTEGEIIKIKVSQGETISMDQVLLDVMTDKASMEVPSAIAGTIQKIEVKEGDIVSVGSSLFTVKTKGDSSQKPIPEEIKKEASPSFKKQDKETLKSSSSYNPLAIPATKKLAQELGLSLDQVKGTGAQGEIKREDLINYIKSNLKSAQSFVPSKISAPLPQNLEEEKRETLRGIKRLMFESMTLSKATIPHFTIGEQAQVEHLVNTRKEMKVQLEKQGLKVGYLPFFIKALVPVLKEFPIFNSVYDSKTKELVFRKNFNIGFAVDGPDGLLVPVLKQAQNKSLLELIKETGQLAEETRQGTIQRENLIGASITLTNLGSLGGIYGTPIINAPEMAILGIYSLYHQLIKSTQGNVEEKTLYQYLYHL